MLLQIQENNLHLVFELMEERPVYLLHMDIEPMAEEPDESVKNGFHIQEIQFLSILLLLF